MAKTSLDKKNIPNDLTQIKALIDERNLIVSAETEKKHLAQKDSDKIIDEANDEIRMLRIKGADLLGIPSTLKAKKGIVERNAPKEPSA